jgi:hypothetical protein
MSDLTVEHGLVVPAVLLLVFNRPEPTREVFACIRAARPARLYIAADGPRPHKPGEVQRCLEVQGIVTAIDWPCEVRTLFRHENLGCREAVTSAISWFFDHEEAGIILEDDCVPAPDLFRFCAYALERWRDEPRVMHVGGTALVEGTGPHAMTFSRLVPIWGWATWRRAWRLYDPTMSRICDLGNLPLNDWYGSQASNVKRAIRRIHDGNVDAWGARWVLSVLANQGLSVLPRVNLVSNIGHGADATHTTVDSHVANLPVGSLPSVLVPPDQLQSSRVYDEAYLAVLNHRGQLIRRVWRRLKRALAGAQS